MAEIKYPNQIKKIARSTKSIIVDAFLATPNVENGDSPLEMHAGWSRFVLTILEKNGANYGSVSANIPAEEADLILFKTEEAVKEYLHKGTNADEEVSPAYTATFFSGLFKGKTAAQVLTENASNKDKLLETKATLEANVSRYPNNAIQIKAIDDAIKMLESGTLKKNSSNSQIIDIYNVDIKAPHAKKLDKDGFTDVYSIKITCDLSKNYPFIVSITNCLAPVIRNGDMVSPDMKKAKNSRTSNLMLSMSEWYQIATKMKNTVTLFEQMNFVKMYDIMLERINSLK